MRQYKGYYIDNVSFHSKAEIDNFLKTKAVKAYEDACRYFASSPSFEAALYQDEQAERLNREYGYDWDTIEQIGIEALQTA